MVDLLAELRHLEEREMAELLIAKAPKEDDGLPTRAMMGGFVAKPAPQLPSRHRLLRKEVLPYALVPVLVACYCGILVLVR